MDDEDLLSERKCSRQNIPSSNLIKEPKLWELLEVHFTTYILKQIKYQKQEFQIDKRKDLNSTTVRELECYTFFIENEYFNLDSLSLN